jgi:glycosyltransferase involved in cell wall biosynthesis
MNLANDAQKRKLTIWLINPYGPLPSEGWRDYSFVTFGKTLANSGHDVVWWTSSFSHHFKKQRCNGWRDEPVFANFKIRLVPSPAYKKNISFGRFWRDVVFAFNTMKRGKRTPGPDIIIYAENPLTMGFAGYALARHHKCPVIYDQMDLWPELIVKTAPHQFKFLINALFWPVYKRRRLIFRKLDGVIALAKPYLQAVLDEIEKSNLPPSVVVYNGIDVTQFRKHMKTPLPETLASDMQNTNVKAVFAGSFGPSYDIQALIDVAKRLDEDAIPISFYVAGDGPLRGLVEEADRTLSNFKYLGVLSPQQLPSVYAAADIGLSTYSAASNVEMPDKFYDYTAAGLAIINSLSGEVSKHIAETQSGLQYTAGSRESLYTALKNLTLDETLLSSSKLASWEIGEVFDSKIQHVRLEPLIQQVISTASDFSTDVALDR